MKIKQRQTDGVTILDISGEMYGGPDNMKLVEVVSELASEKKLDLVINLSKVKWISSTGLGILVSARSRFAKEGGKIKLCQLNLIFDVYDTEGEALQSMK